MHGRKRETRVPTEEEKKAKAEKTAKDLERTEKAKAVLEKQTKKILEKKEKLKIKEKTAKFRAAHHGISPVKFAQIEEKKQEEKFENLTKKENLIKQAQLGAKGKLVALQQNASQAEIEITAKGLNKEGPEPHPPVMHGRNPLVPGHPLSEAYARDPWPEPRDACS